VNSPCLSFTKRGDKELSSPLFERGDLGELIKYE